MLHLIQFPIGMSVHSAQKNCRCISAHLDHAPLSETLRFSYLTFTQVINKVYIAHFLVATDILENLAKFESWDVKSWHKQTGRVTQQLSCNPKQQSGLEMNHHLLPEKKNKKNQTLRTIKSCKKRLTTSSIQVRQIKV